MKEKYQVRQVGIKKFIIEEQDSIFHLVRSATIEFVNGSFHSCECYFKTDYSKPESYDDWMFILKIANTIKDLSEKKTESEKEMVGNNFKEDEK